MSLKNRLLALLLAVTTIGLIAAGLIVNTVVGLTLGSRAEEQLQRAEFTAERVLGAVDSGDAAQSTSGLTDLTMTDPRRGGPGDGPGGPGGVTAIKFDSLNTVTSRIDPAFSTMFDVTQIPVNVLQQARKSAQPVRFSVSDFLGDAQRIGDDDAVVVTMVSTSEGSETMRQLLLTELIVGGLVLLIVGAGSSLLIRLGLKPLRAIAATADKIATGDNSQRVPRGGGAEVDALASSLNSAFDARDASETRLRTFIADASHELRTPLTSIRGYAQLVERGMLSTPAEVQNAAGRIEKESSRLGAMVSTLLSLTRLDLGRAIDLKPVELTIVAADAIADAQVADDSHTYSLRAHASAPVMGDESQLRQAVGNLLGNARDHTPAGTSINVMVDGRDGVVRLDVVDHGGGVPDEFKGKVFDRFFRMDAAHGRSATGHGGLGLSIVQAIAEAHGGTVSVHDTDREAAEGATGATFRIELPLAPVATTGEDHEPEEAHVPEQTQ